MIRGVIAVGRREGKADRRVLPHRPAAEASILGGVLLRPEVLALLSTLEPDDFYDPRHKIVFEAIRGLEAASKPIDVVTLETEIERMGKLEAIGGVAFLGELALRVPTADNVEAYAADVVDARVLRDVAVRLSEIVEEIYLDDTSGEEIIHLTNASLMQIRVAAEAPVLTMGQLAATEADRVVADVQARARGELVYAGVPTGVSAIDERCGGNPIGVMTLVIARPATFKTSVAMSFAKAAKTIADMDSLLCSYEDAGLSFGQRALAQETGFATERIRARKLDAGADLGAFVRGAGRAMARQESFLDCSGWSVEQLVRRVRRENVRRVSLGKPRLRQILVDYIQKMPTPEWARTRDEGVSHISRVLSTFASTDDLAVVAFCQLNRDVEKRDDHRPRLSDIRDSGSLEQDGKMIYGIYYPCKYDAKNHDESELYMLVLKNAQGAAGGELRLYLDAPTHSIYNSALDYQQARAMRGR
jgi:replicative DNA helicase